MHATSHDNEFLIIDGDFRVNFINILHLILTRLGVVIVYLRTDILKPLQYQKLVDFQLIIGYNIQPIQQHAQVHNVSIIHSKIELTFTYPTIFVIFNLDRFHPIALLKVISKGKTDQD